MAWLYSRCAGIQPLEPGFEKVLIAPVVGGSMTSVSCTYESVAGRIASAWELSGNQFSLRVEVPRPAEVRMPDGTTRAVVAGVHEFACLV